MVNLALPGSACLHWTALTAFVASIDTKTTSDKRMPHEHGYPRQNASLPRESTQTNHISAKKKKPRAYHACNVVIQPRITLRQELTRDLRSYSITISNDPVSNGSLFTAVQVAPSTYPLRGHTDRALPAGLDAGEVAPRHQLLQRTTMRLSAVTHGTLGTGQFFSDAHSSTRDQSPRQDAVRMLPRL
ncbi:hypothetical protein BST61_g10580 [Cercospora zeina]